MSLLCVPRHLRPGRQQVLDNVEVTTLCPALGSGWRCNPGTLEHVANFKEYIRDVAHVGLMMWGTLALRAHCALLSDYVPPKEPLGTPLGNTLRIRGPKLDWRGPGWGPSRFLWHGEGPGPLGGNLTACWAPEIEGSQVVSLNFRWQRRWTPSCSADSPVSTHLGSIPGGGVRFQPSQPPW